MIRRIFVCLSVVFTLLCFITSCKKDSPSNDNLNSKESVKDLRKENKKKELVIRDDKTDDTEEVNESLKKDDDDAQSFENHKNEENIETEKPINNTLYEVAEKLPEFPGGVTALENYLKEQTKKVCNTVSLKKSLRVMISFIVETNGTLTNVGIAKSSDNSTIDNEAKNIVSKMPNWTPAQNNGQNVRMKYTVPVIFNPAH